MPSRPFVGMDRVLLCIKQILLMHSNSCPSSPLNGRSIVSNGSNYIMSLSDWYLADGLRLVFLTLYLRLFAGLQTILHLLLDFLTIDKPDLCAGLRTKAVLALIFSRLHVPLAAHKCIGPADCLEFG